jgi:hypothetical protein
MQILETPIYTGDKKKTGSLIFDKKGRLLVFVTYCDICHGKLAMTIQEARAFAKKYDDCSNKKRTKRLLKEIDRRTI